MSVYVCVCVMRWPTASGQTLRPLGQATPTSATSVVLLSVGHRYRAGNDQGLDVVASIDGVFQSLFFQLVFQRLVYRVPLLACRLIFAEEDVLVNRGIFLVSQTVTWFLTYSSLSLSLPTLRCR